MQHCLTTTTAPVPTSSPLPTPAGSTNGPGCPANFFMYKSTCYSVVNKPTVWSEARKACQLFNGDLASTSDIFEVARLDLALLSNHVSGQAWIGLKYDQVFLVFMNIVLVRFLLFSFFNVILNLL